MKRTLRILGFLLVSILICMPLNSCDKDEDEPNNPAWKENHDPALVGTWEHVDSYPEGNKVIFIYKFQKDGVFRSSVVETASDGSYISNKEYKGKWTTKDNFIYVITTEGYGFEPEEVHEDVLPYKIQNDRLIIGPYIFEKAS